MADAQGQTKPDFEYDYIGDPEDAKPILQADGMPTSVDWQRLKSWIETFESWFNGQGRYLLWMVGIDAVGFEVSVGVELSAGLAGVNIDPVGLTFLWITYADVDPSEHTGPDKHPVAGNPHAYAFSSASISGGPGGKAAIDYSVDFFRADRWGEHNLPSSWAGPAVSLDAEGSLGKYLGVQVSGSRFASIDPGHTGPLGLPFDRSDAWTGASFSVGTETGAGAELQVGVTLVGACKHLTSQYQQVSDMLDFSQSQDKIEQQIEKTPKPESSDYGDWKAPEQGDFYYQ